MTLVAIAVRVGSKRFPGKCLKEIEGIPMIEQVIQRVQMCRKVDQIVLACGNYKDNKTLLPIADRNDISCHFMDDGKLIEQYKELAGASDALVRITGDCPLIDPWLVDEVIMKYKDCELSTNVLWPRTFPKGLDTEVFNWHTLGRLDREAFGEDRNHITLHIYKHPHEYKIKSVKSKENFSRYNFSVDTDDDLDKVRHVYSQLGGRVIPWREMIRRVYGE